MSATLLMRGPQTWLPQYPPSQKSGCLAWPTLPALCPCSCFLVSVCSVLLQSCRDHGLSNRSCGRERVFPEKLSLVESKGPLSATAGARAFRSGWNCRKPSSCGEASWRGKARPVAVQGPLAAGGGGQQKLRQLLGYVPGCEDKSDLVLALEELQVFK